MSLINFQQSRRKAYHLLRCFSSINQPEGNRAFSAVTRPEMSHKAMPFNFSIIPEERYDVSRTHKLTKSPRKTQLENEFSFRKDHAFLKFLMWINLESKDHDSISLARLMAYNIFSQLKEKKLNNDITVGLIKGLSMVLEIFSKNRKLIENDQELMKNACTTFSQNADDITSLVSFLNSGASPKQLIFTKEIGGRTHEGTAEVHHILQTNVGHASHKLINDDLNYRVELNQSLIALKENLDESDLNTILNFSHAFRKDILIVSKRIDSELLHKIIELKISEDLRISVLELGDLKDKTDEQYINLIDTLPNADIPETSDFQFKTAKRILMNADTTYFFDSSFDEKSSIGSNPSLTEMVEVHLKSPKEEWTHRCMNDIIDANANYQNSLKHGLLPESRLSFYLANEELKTYYSDNSSIQEGLEILQNAIDSTVKCDSDDFSDSALDFKEALSKNIVDGTYVPANRPAQIVGDVVTIINFLINNN